MARSTERSQGFLIATEAQRLVSMRADRNQVGLARRFGLSRARVTQILAILRLPHPVVDYLASLFHEAITKYNERELRRSLALPTEEEQMRAFEELRAAIGARPS